MVCRAGSFGGGDTENRLQYTQSLYITLCRSKNIIISSGREERGH